MKPAEQVQLTAPHTFLSKLKRKGRLKLRLWLDLPLDSSPWQKRAGAPFSHIACPRPPQSYSGCLDCPWFVRLRCVLDAGMDCIQHPIRAAAEWKTGEKRKNEQIHAPSRCALSSSCRPTRSAQVPLTDWQKKKNKTGSREAHSPPWKLLLWLLATPS